MKKQARKFISYDGHVHSSKKECMIDNILYQFGIEHKKDINYPNSKMKCDWKIGDTYIEFCGMKYHSNIIARKRYNKRLDEKANYCLQNNINFMHIMPSNKDRQIFNDFVKLFGGK